MNHVKIKHHFLIKTFLFLIPFTFTVSNGQAAHEYLKVQKIALLHPVISQKFDQKSYIYHCFQKYAQARSQATLIPFSSNGEPVALEDLQKQGYDLAVLPKIQRGGFIIKRYNVEIYQLSPIQKLWTLSNTLDSDMELLFLMLDRSILSGIKMSPSKVCIGMVPGKDGDWGANYPCGDIEYSLRQLTNIEIKPISLKKYPQPLHQVNELSGKFKLDYLLFYQSDELNLTNPLINGEILKSDGEIYGKLAVRITTRQMGALINNPNFSPQIPSSLLADHYPIDSSQIKRESTEPEHIYVKSNYLSSVAEEMTNYLLAVLLTEFCHPEEEPLKLKLTGQRKYIKGADVTIPQLDDGQPLSKYTIRFKVE